MLLRQCTSGGATSTDASNMLASHAKHFAMREKAHLDGVLRAVKKGKHKLFGKLETVWK